MSDGKLGTCRLVEIPHTKIDCIKFHTDRQTWATIANWQPLPAQPAAPTTGQKLPIDRPCSACSAGDTEMKYHDHQPPFRDPALNDKAPEMPKQSEPFVSGMGQAKPEIFNGAWGTCCKDHSPHTRSQCKKRHCGNARKTWTLWKWHFPAPNVTTAPEQNFFDAGLMMNRLDATLRDAGLIHGIRIPEADPVTAPEEAAAMKFHKKPVVVEAVQLTWANWNKICAFVPKPWFVRGVWLDDSGKPLPESETNFKADGDKAIGLLMQTLESDQFLARGGDWIIKGVKGEFYPCKPDVFAATYEPAFSERETQSAERVCNQIWDAIEKQGNVGLAVTFLESHMQACSSARESQIAELTKKLEQIAKLSATGADQS